MGLVLAVSVMFLRHEATAAQAPVDLGLAGSFAILANTGISNATFPAAITGDIGVGPGVTSTAITGSHPVDSRRSGDPVLVT